MRRGIRGRGYGRPPQHHQNQGRSSPSSSGANNMMTNQLQGLKDIDMELELLKRKREIIEQQQQMLSSNYRQRNNYEQPMFNESRDNNRYDDYTSLYDNPREAEPYGGGSSSRKRTHIPVWENESPPKRFAAPTQQSRGVGIKKSFGSRLGPPPQTARSDYQPRSAAHQSYKRPSQFVPPHKRKEFNPTKVTKSSSGPPPLMKFANYQPAERKKFVSQALANSKVEVRHAAPPVDRVLRADCEPSRQVAGRLELGLGAIMKDLRLANPEYEELFKAPVAARTMKQTVRERVRAAMMGKAVTTTEVVKAAYYELFPMGDGNDILMKGLGAQKGSDFIEIKSDDPEVYFKKNMYRLMSLKLDEMTKKLEEIYMGKNPGFAPKKRHRPQGKLNSQNEQSKAVTESSEIEIKADDDAIMKTEENTETDGAEIKTEEASGGTEEPIVIEAVSDEPSVKTDEPAVKTDAVTKVVAQTSESAYKETPKLVNYANLVNLDQYRAFDNLMNVKMVQLIKKYAPSFLNIMDVDAMYRKTKASILMETKKKLGVHTDVPAETTQDNATANKPTEKRFLTPLQYYVKIVGKPALPKRKAMESFFEEFKPKSVKKHRTIYNLLFVGFADKEPYEKILAADGSVIGRNTLDIKISERNDNKKSQNNSIVNADTNNDNQTELKLYDSGSEVIGADLDEQIADLLSSIRRSEQQDNSDVISESPSNNDENIKEENEEVKVIEQEPNEAQKDDKIDLSTEQDEDVVEIKDVPPKFNEIIEIQDDQVESVEEKMDESENNEVIAVESETNGTETGENENNKDKDDENENTKDRAGENENNKDRAGENENNKDKTDETEKNDDKTGESEKNEAKTAETVNEGTEEADKVTALKKEVNAKGTPTRSSARLATPSGIRTRRMSKLE